MNAPVQHVVPRDERIQAVPLRLLFEQRLQFRQRAQFGGIGNAAGRAGNSPQLGGGDPDWIRTNDLVLRRHLLYPTELRDRTRSGISQPAVGRKVGRTPADYLSVSVANS